MLQREKLLGFDSECVLVKGIDLGNVPGPPEPSILFFQPCASIEGRVNCEIRFGIQGKGVVEAFYDLPILSKVLDAYGEGLSEVRVSSALGVARIRWRGKRILAFKNGRMVIREAVGEEDAKVAIDFLSKLLAPAIICDKCGQVVLNCAAASCGECTTQQAFSTTSLASLPWVEVKEAESLIRASLEKEVTGEGSVASYESLSTQVDKFTHRSLDLIVDSNSREELAVGILLLRQAWDLHLILELLRKTQRLSDRLSSVSKPIQRMLELWLLALRESVDSIADEDARKRAIKRWTQVSAAWRSLLRDGENNPKLETLLDLLDERWPR